MTGEQAADAAAWLNFFFLSQGALPVERAKAVLGKEVEQLPEVRRAWKESYPQWDLRRCTTREGEDAYNTFYLGEALNGRDA